MCGKIIIDDKQWYSHKSQALIERLRFKLKSILRLETGLGYLAGQAILQDVSQCDNDDKKLKKKNIKIRKKKFTFALFSLLLLLISSCLLALDSRCV